MKSTFNGIVNVYKEAGFTSFDVVAKLRGIFGQKKIGHTGTLDPDAMGVLPICLGNATKVVELLMDHNKEYVAELLLGVRTDTQDISGEVLERADTGNIRECDVIEAIKGFIGPLMQIPPMYSALKVGGKKLCDLARNGETVERNPRPVTIYDIEILGMDLPVVKMKVRCSKGTYIRTLCDDIGTKLGCGGTMKSLERTAVGSFLKADSITLPELQKLKDEDRLLEAVTMVDSLFPDYPGFMVCGEGIKKLENGNKLSCDEMMLLREDGVPCGTDSQNTVNVHTCVRVYRPDKTFAGIYKREKTGDSFTPEKMFL